MEKIKLLLQKIKNNLPSKETVKRSLLKALKAGYMSALASFVALPVNLSDPKKYLYALFIGMLTGFLVGMQKLASGYIKYDLNQNNLQN